VLKRASGHAPSVFRSPACCYLIQEWDGDRWVFRESSELHSGTPQYEFGEGPQEPPSGLTDEASQISEG
jgi:hypothetical protein